MVTDNFDNFKASKADPYYYIEDLARDTQHDLEKLNITILDKKIIRKTAPYYEDFAFVGEQNYKRIAINYNNDVYDVEWKIKLNQEQAEYISKLVWNINNMGRDLDQTQERLRISEQELQERNIKLKNLKELLRNNPGIQEQWDEFMAMMKLAGLESPIL